MSSTCGDLNLKNLCGDELLKMILTLNDFLIVSRGITNFSFQFPFGYH